MPAAPRRLRWIYLLFEQLFFSTLIWTLNGQRDPTFRYLQFQSQVAKDTWRQWEPSLVTPFHQNSP